MGCSEGGARRAGATRDRADREDEAAAKDWRWPARGEESRCAADHAAPGRRFGAGAEEREAGAVLSGCGWDSGSRARERLAAGIRVVDVRGAASSVRSTALFFLPAGTRARGELPHVPSRPVPWHDSLLDLAATPRSRSLAEAATGAADGGRCGRQGLDHGHERPTVLSSAMLRHCCLSDQTQKANTQHCFSVTNDTFRSTDNRHVTEPVHCKKKHFCNQRRVWFFP